MKNFVMILICLSLILGIACTIKEFYVDRYDTSAAAEIDDEYRHLHKEIDNSSQPWNLLLVNDYNPMPEKTEITLVETKYGERIDERIMPYITEMLSDAEKSGFTPEITSGYRSRESQQDIFDSRKKEYRALGHTKKEAESLANEYVAKPGYSEHETGLAVDINSSDGDSRELYMWLEANCHKYGFIIRYPAGKEKITGIEYEPWHLRYVGENTATYLQQNNLTLEEYLVGKQ